MKMHSAGRHRWLIERPRSKALRSAPCAEGVLSGVAEQQCGPSRPASNSRSNNYLPAKDSMNALPSSLRITNSYFGCLDTLR